ncbi:MAG: hypothetical protein HY821_16260 [Acidobacteria bacterium]|nr:hypothetical protein [Acidobacteriota bacterium]
MALPVLAESSGGGRKLIAVTTMKGKGTWEDPRRPALPVEGGFNYHWIASDDGQYAIVELELSRVTAEGLQDLTDVKTGKGGAVKVFERGQGKRDDVEKELKKYRKDFDLDDFLTGHKQGGAK